LVRPDIKTRTKPSDTAGVRPGFFFIVRSDTPSDATPSSVMDPLAFILSLLVLINPFALFVYLNPVIDGVGIRQFLRHVFMRATLISFGILAVFVLTGTSVFDQLLGIRFDAFRIFGGVVIFSIALVFIVQGKQSLIALRDDLDALASEIALPYMVGAATISICILAGNDLDPLMGLGALAGALLINYGAIALLIAIKYKLLRNGWRVAFDKFMGILLRINGFFIGAIGIDLVVTGVLAIYNSSVR